MAERKQASHAEEVVTAGAASGGVVIDATGEDSYWRDHYVARPYVEQGKEYIVYQPAYLYGVEAQGRYQGKSFNEVEADLRAGWEKARGQSTLTWDQARLAVRDAFDRVIQLREEQLRVSKQAVKAGEVRVRKEVITEQQTLDVPVTREEVVIERRPVSGRAATGEIKEEEIRVPVSKEKVDVTKEAVVTEEVTVGKRQVTETETVGGTVRKEEVRVEKEGEVDVHARDVDKNRPKK